MAIILVSNRQQSCSHNYLLFNGALAHSAGGEYKRATGEKIIYLAKSHL